MCDTCDQWILQHLIFSFLVALLSSWLKVLKHFVFAKRMKRVRILHGLINRIDRSSGPLIETRKGAGVVYCWGVQEPKVACRARGSRPIGNNPAETPKRSTAKTRQRLTQRVRYTSPVSVILFVERTRMWEEERGRATVGVDRERERERERERDWRELGEVYVDVRWR